MIWLTWRQLRVQLLVVLVVVAAACVWLAVTGRRLADLARRNDDVYDLLTGTDRLLYNGGIVVLVLAPALLGIFWGAPLVARELENGTHRLVWNQSVTRARWLAVKLGVTALATAAAAGVLTAAITWWAQPIDGAQSGTRGSLPARITPISFAMRGVVPVGYAVFALLLGVLVGLVLRRSIAAMAVTLAIYALVQVAMPLWVRPHLAPATTTSVVISEETLDGVMSDAGAPFKITTHTDDPRDWILTNQTVDARGSAAGLPDWFADCLPPAPGGSDGGTVQVNPSAGSLGECLSRLTDEGYRQRVVYQPRTNFWRLQWTELGVYLAASGLLAGASFWWLRRRAG